MAFGVAFGEAMAVQAGPINVNLFDLLLLASVVLLILEVAGESGQDIPSGNRVVIGIVLGYCAYQVAVILPVSVIFHDLEAVAVARQLEIRIAVILIPYVYLVGLKYMPSGRLVAWVNGAALFLAFFAMYQYATVGILGEQGDAGAFRLRELWGGATLLFGFLILTSLFLRRPTAAAYATALVGLVGLALTNHRSGYVALIATMPPLLLNSRRAAKRALVIGVVLATAALLLFVVSPTTKDSVFYSLRTLVNPTADKTAADRVDRSKLGWDYFLANPLGDYQWSKRYYLVDVGPDVFEPHNFIIQLLGQQGIIGFAFFLALIAATVRIGLHNRRDRTSAVILAYFAFYLLFCLFNTNLLNISNSFLLMLSVALILGRNAVLAKAGEEEAVASVNPPSIGNGGLDHRDRMGLAESD